MNTDRKHLLEQLEEKFNASGQDLDTHLNGLLHANHITYWDYIQTDALLNLQIQRTRYPDEMVFIMYHQVNEIIFKMMLWEIEQVSTNKALTVDFFAEKLYRISRYVDMLSSSFSVMGDGMSSEQYQKFRTTLTPASGFQSAQYRKIEFASTELINLIDNRYRSNIDRETPYSHAFEHLYWQAAGKDHSTGKKNALLTNFEKKYRNEFIQFMKDYNTTNLWTCFKSLPNEKKNDIKLLNAMRHYDHTLNVKWVMAHYNAASKYLTQDDGTIEDATGGSDWRKYMLPKYQKRIFFPELWSESELQNWGIDNLEDYKKLD
ncbi:MAG: tryptophan 2,3-dioxygenase family protein [Bacteroidia bacterium]|jgi:tryptophan 2,3-dioxygenase|nr:tryptophan 2,3-dioxygenase family protein [Bacteroidia bacterium]